LINYSIWVKTIGHFDKGYTTWLCVSSQINHYSQIDQSTHSSLRFLIKCTCLLIKMTNQSIWTFLRTMICNSVRPFGHLKIICYIPYMYIDFMQSSWSNCWINFDSKWTLNKKNVVVLILKFSIAFTTTKGCHKKFSLHCTIILVIHCLFWTKVVHFWCAFTC
jgi:hypothetical protein